jgi:flavin-dependent dehydrogenase
MNAELTSEFRVAKEFSYKTTQHAGNGWVLVGDAWGFIDPIYSSGVYFALKSGEHAADAINDALTTGDTSGKQLGRWVDEFHAGTKLIRQLVDAYYTNEFSFGRFMKAHPEHKGNLTDLLIGRIFYDGAGRIFDDMNLELAKAKQAAIES